MYMEAVSDQPKAGFPEQPTDGSVPMSVYSPQGVPPGLEYLTQLDKLDVRQEVIIKELFTCCEFNNKYRIYNAAGQEIYFAHEENTFCHRYWCGAARGFSMIITDMGGREVMRIYRRFQCCAGCCWCADNATCGLEIEAQTPTGEVLGYVRQAKTKWQPHYWVTTPDREPVAYIKGPCCICSGPCCKPVEFPMFAPDLQTQIGSVSKTWEVKELISDASNFNITFPVDLEVKAKSAMFAAMFLIDFMFFEK